MTDEVDLAAAQRHAARVAGAVDLVDVRLFEVDSKFISFPRSTEELTYDLEMASSVEYDDGDDFFVLRVNYDVEIIEKSNESTSDRRALARMSFELGALYRFGMPDEWEPFTEGERDAFGQTAGTLALYPYAREFVQELTGRMGLPPLTLSVYRLPYPRLAAAGSDARKALPEPPLPAKRRSAGKKDRSGEGQSA
jgi:hypothetical protein